METLLGMSTAYVGLKTDSTANHNASEIEKALAGLLIDVPVMPFDAFTLTVALRSIA